MASNSIADSLTNLIYIPIINDGFGGYRPEFLSQNLSSMEESFVLCPLCHGVIREACLSGGSTVCKTCVTDSAPIQPVTKVRTSVAQLSVKCPLNERGCSWKGFVKDIETHMRECQELYIECGQKCGTVLLRSETITHRKEKCTNRVIECKHCALELKISEQEPHFLVCDEFPVECGVGCGMILKRKEIEIHNRSECLQALVSCPFAKYGCLNAVLTRADMNKHKLESINKHSDLTISCLMNLEDNSKRQNEVLKEQSLKINKHQKEIEKLYYFISKSTGIIWTIEGVGVNQESSTVVDGPVIKIRHEILSFQAILSENGINLEIYTDIVLATTNMESSLPSAINKVYKVKFQLTFVNQDKVKNSIDNLKTKVDICHKNSREKLCYMKLQDFVANRVGKIEKPGFIVESKLEIFVSWEVLDFNIK